MLFSFNFFSRFFLEETFVSFVKRQKSHSLYVIIKNTIRFLYSRLFSWRPGGSPVIDNIKTI